MAELPLVMTSAGLQPQAPADIRAQLVALVAATNPDYTANLPGSLIEDIASTDTGACVISDSFLVDLVNSVSPYFANPFIINQLGNVYGLTAQEYNNTSLYVVFEGPPGFIIQQGFIVSDGTYQYICNDGGIIGTSGYSLPIYALATLTGSWAVPANSVTQLITSIPSAYTVTVTNPLIGTPSSAAETITQFRARTLTAGLASSTGMSRFLKTILANISGVQQRLISVRQDSINNQWIIIVGGGDPYQVAYGIFISLFNLVNISGATIYISGISNTNPCVITTSTNHNLTTGNSETLTGIVGLSILNNATYVVTVLSATTFSIPVSTLGGATYISGGIVSPNPINQSISIIDYPDNYIIPFVIPPQETVTMTITWETNSPNYVSEAAVAQAVAPATADYINSLYVGTSPINLISLRSVFRDSTASILPSDSIISINYAVSINGVGVTPVSGTQIIQGDPNSYFYATSAGITVLGP